MVKNNLERCRDTRTLQQSVTHYLDDRFNCGSLTPVFDAPSRQRVIALENRAKLALALESADPVEFTYHNLVHEIDTEARFGVFLASPAGNAARLRRLNGGAGISGRLHQLFAEIGPVLFADTYQASGKQLDQVLTMINCRYDRANLDAEISELILMHLLGDEDDASDRADELRQVFYASHEDRVRRRFDLAPPQNGSAVRRMVARACSLSDAAGDYTARIAAIRERAGTA